MKIIPVIDLMHGVVVHAQLGMREHYQPIQSQLCRSSAPLDVVRTLLELYPFQCLYIADLDAITGQGHHLDTILQIQAQYPQLEIWLDAGIKTMESLAIWDSVRIKHVIGTENISTTNALTEISHVLHANFVLSLDFNQSVFLGNAALEKDTEHWPENIIVMTLSRVGSQLGADIERLLAIKNIANGRKIYAAGGIRNHGDIITLQNLSLSGALVATALHNLQLDPNDYN
ncbi:1-(5-phosphoribosyl)-5-[(5-phosphoribosylamino)methylideneamino] imidazole-4-carboxamide isomerase [mine drainage metagenome]|uniref:1-(5-phosphoribosyl)-5-[(5-phosphoribosylamino)methylideneamino] imidazole-4-carboxamide isomerase n=1 Tax=mine drainage metagenome TaxID=410659 RepID=A0A1J5T9V9_9ZZZZ